MRRGVTFSIGILSLMLLTKSALAAPDRIGQGDLAIEAGERVGDVVSFGGSLVVRGWVTGDAVALGGGVRLMPGARVDGDITALGGNIVVEPGATALGSQTGIGDDGVRALDPNLGPAAQLTAPPIGPGIAGQTDAPTSAFERWIQQKVEDLGKFIERIGHMLALYGLLVVLGLLMLGVAPLRTRALAAAVAAHPGRSLGLGLAVILGSLVALVLLSITVIGVPLAAVLAVVVTGAAVLGLTGVSILIGELLPFSSLRDRQALKLLLGAGVLVLALSIPYVGGVIGVVATVLGLGSLAVTRLRPGHDVFIGRGPYRSSPVL